MNNLTEHSSLEMLQALPLWQENEKLLNVEPAGESNMNLVLRIRTTLKSVILKQSKPYVRKFPHIPAPIERIEIEMSFFQLLEDDETLRKYSPKVILFDERNHIILLEDLGNGTDYTDMYADGFIWHSSDFQSICRYLAALHELQVSNFPDNMKMKKLNHEHLFNFPFREENGFDLDTVQPGLQLISLPYKTDSKLKTALEQLGKRYLSHGTTLLHGDFYPASWLKTEQGVKIIDTEFAFMGDCEFDLGVMFAHFDLAKVDSSLYDEFLHHYNRTFNEKLMNKYRGMEIMRRLIGIAQLPLSLSLEEKKSMLESARNLILAK